MSAAMTPSRNGRDRVVTLDALAKRVMELKSAGRIVAHCHGCFDILHAGHLRHFEEARALADVLVVTVTPDRFVNKGPARPVFGEMQRAELVAGLAVVDWVAVNGWPSAVPAIELVRPSLFVKGAEYETRALEVNPNFIEEARAVESVGGRVAFTYGATLSSTVAFRRLHEGKPTS
jgi:rfaE bifunctional protein nucleotidyltransferase chain/domain